MKATNSIGELEYIPNCDIQIPTDSGIYEIRLRVLPEISDSHSFQYQNESITGRAVPIKTASHGEDRTINMKVKFVILRDSDARTNLNHIRALQGATYPREIPQSPYVPPPICRIRCGNLLTGPNTSGYVCAVLRQCNVSYDTSVAWYVGVDEFTYVPYKVEVDLSWEVVYSSQNLPGQNKIMRGIF